MDTGEGRFEPIKAADDKELSEKLRALQKKHTQHGGTFRIGEEVELKGSRFRIKSIKPKQLVLKLLKR